MSKTTKTVLIVVGVILAVLLVLVLLGVGIFIVMWNSQSGIPEVNSLGTIRGSSSAGFLQNFSGFSQELGDYSSSVITSAMSRKMSVIIEGLNINDAQAYYMLANGISVLQLVQGNDDFDEKAYNDVIDKEIPKGYQMPEEVLRVLGYVNEEGSTEYYSEGVVAYEIKKDSYVDGYSREDVFTFYGDKNGIEKHYVTSDGTVFTLPGFPREQPDGEVRYYITPTSYYVVKGENTTITPEDTGYTLVDSPIQGDDLTA